MVMITQLNFKLQFENQENTDICPSLLCEKHDDTDYSIITKKLKGAELTNIS